MLWLPPVSIHSQSSLLEEPHVLLALAHGTSTSALAATCLQPTQGSCSIRIVLKPGSQEAAPGLALQHSDNAAWQQHERAGERQARPCARRAHAQAQAHCQQRQRQVPACADLHACRILLRTVCRSELANLTLERFSPLWKHSLSLS